MFIITPAQLSEKICQNENIAIIDVRSNLNNPDEGYEQYKESHHPGAVYLHLKKDLSGPIREHGGSHPLPDVDVFAETLGDLGIDEMTLTVIYDEANHMFATRAWWMLHTLGHEKVYVLEGGFTAWKKAGYELTGAIPQHPRKTFKPRMNMDEVIHMEEVKNRNQEKVVLLDSRAYERYLGKVEPLYDKAGHIPGAKNYFWQDVLNDEGHWKSVAELKEHFKDLKDAEEIIVSCGSGISACPNILALKRAGFLNVKLYPGSFSDWISYEENVLETKDET